MSPWNGRSRSRSPSRNQASYSAEARIAGIRSCTVPMSVFAGQVMRATVPLSTRPATAKSEYLGRTPKAWATDLRRPSVAVPDSPGPPYLVTPRSNTASANASNSGAGPLP